MLNEVRKYGPYLHSEGTGRMIYIIWYEDGTKRTVAVARYMMEHHLGRNLGPREVVDHINNDPSDDRLENLQVITSSENNTKDRMPASVWCFTCPECGKYAEKPMRDVRHNQGTYKKAGPFCGRACAGKYGTSIQYAEVSKRQRKLA